MKRRIRYSPSRDHNNNRTDLLDSNNEDEDDDTETSVDSEALISNDMRGETWRRIVLGSEGASTPVPPLVDCFISNSSVVTDSSMTPREHSAHRRSSPDAKRGQAHRRPPAATPPRRRARSQLSARVKSDSPRTDDDYASLASASSSSTSSAPLMYQLPDNCQPRVVEADIQRSLWTLYPETTERDQMRRKLKMIIFRILAPHADRHYYQGLHELMGYVMYVMQSTCVPPEDVVSLCEQLMLTRLRRFTEKKLKSSEALLYAVHAIVAKEHPELAMQLEACGVGPESHYAVAWVITWYTHSVQSTDVLGSLFDYFIIEEDGLNVIFFTAALIVSEHRRILAAVKQFQSEEEDGSVLSEDISVLVMARVYAELNQLPAKVLQPMTPSQLVPLLRTAAIYRSRHTQLVHDECENFMAGRVRKLGFLANQGTRNAALRLLWRLLPREWRNPVVQRRLGRMVVVVSVAVAVGIAIASKPEGWWNWVLLPSQ